MFKSKLGRTIAAAMAGVLLYATVEQAAQADTIYVAHSQCKINAYSMYSSLSIYHIYSYIADIYLNVYFQTVKSNPNLAQMYLNLYFMLNQISWFFLINYIYSYIAFIFCEYIFPPRYGWNARSGQLQPA